MAPATCTLVFCQSGVHVPHYLLLNLVLMLLFCSHSLAALCCCWCVLFPSALCHMTAAADDTWLLSGLCLHACHVQSATNCHDAEHLHVNVTTVNTAEGVVFLPQRT